VGEWESGRVGEVEESGRGRGEWAEESGRVGQAWRQAGLAQRDGNKQVSYVIALSALSYRS